jgi:hypothetical protein
VIRNKQKDAMTEYHFEFHHFVSEEERRKSLQELEGHNWGDGDSFPSHLVLTIHALRRKLLGDFTIEDVRLMIGQNMSLDYMLPLAIEHLQRDPFVAGDFYDGDLLKNVLNVEASFWHKRPDLRGAIEEIIQKIEPFPESFRKDLVVFRQT